MLNKKNITLTNNETILCQYLIGTTEGNQVVCHETFFPKEMLEKLNLNFQQVKGVYGSLVNKDILTFSNNINGLYDSYEWTVNVEDYGQGEINTVDKLLTAINNQIDGE
tara:strand:- start:1095 stop:1421 length:327 start_codon:yes stop_codon:yes gene_type:complete